MCLEGFLLPPLDRALQVQIEIAVNLFLGDVQTSFTLARQGLRLRSRVSSAR